MWESSVIEAESRLYKSCVRSVMSCGFERWAMKKFDIQTNAGNEND